MACYESNSTRQGEMAKKKNEVGKWPVLEFELISISPFCN
jgi:hypothetical protein